MKKIDVKFIEKIADIMRNSGLTQVQLKDGYDSLFVKSDTVMKKKEFIDSAKTEQIKNSEIKKNVVPVISNMIGLFFSKPSPDGIPFIQVGKRVEKGQQIGIIETIKLMNKITSEVSGIVKEVCIEDGKPVEYGQTIMYIEQD